MSQAQPITGRPRIDQFKDLANCLRDILGELPDQDDITDALNVAVKLDRMLEFVGSFPSSESLTEMARQVAAMDARFTAQSDQMTTQHANLQAQIALLQKSLTTENRLTFDADIPHWRNEEWRDVGTPLTDATTSISVMAKSLISDYKHGHAYLQLGILTPGASEVEALTEVRGITASTYVQTIELPNRLPKGAQLKVRGSVSSHFLNPPTSRRVRTNTLHTAWGGHVYCRTQTHEDSDDVAYQWQYNNRYPQHNDWPPSNASWSNLGQPSDWDDELEGVTTNWLCLPDDPGAASRIKWVRCKVTFTDESNDDHVLTTGAVRVHPYGGALYRVTPVIFM